jgi:hypothetical protein
MSYEPNIGLARKISRGLRDAGFKVTRSISESIMTVRSGDGGAIVVECMKQHTHGYDIALWRPPEGFERGGRGADAKASQHLLLTLAKLFKENGLHTAT